MEVQEETGKVEVPGSRGGGREAEQEGLAQNPWGLQFLVSAPGS